MDRGRGGSWSERWTTRVLTALLGLGLAACDRATEVPPASDPTPLVAGPDGGELRPTPTWTGPALPRARLELPVPGEPVGVAWIDPLGTGSERLVALTQGPGRLVVWERLPDRASPLAESRAHPVGDFALGPVVLAHPDGARLGLASRADRTLESFAFDVRGELRPAARLGLPAAPRALAGGPFAEGALGPGSVGAARLVAALSGGMLVVWGGAEHAELEVETGLDLPCSIALGADARSLWIGDQATRSLTRVVFEGGAPRTGGRIGLGGIPRDLVELDLDGDGDLELVVTGGDRSLWIFGLERAGGVEALVLDPGEPLTLEVGPIPLRLVPLRDSNGGSPEIALLSHYGLAFEVLAGFGAAAPRRFEAYAGQSPWDLAAGRPGAGAPLLAIANRGAARVSLIAPDGRGGWSLEDRVRAGPAPHSLALGDLDGDGLPEAAVICSLDATLAVLPGRGGRLVAGAPRVPAGEGADRIVLTDLDGDGHLDAVWLARGADGLFRPRLARGDGTGALAESVELPGPAVRSAGDLLALDLDGDGRVELVLADPDGGRVAWRRGDGSVGALDVPGGPRRLAPLARAGRRGLAVALGQAGERGGLALLGPLGSAGELELVEVAFLPLPATTLDVAAADLDGDGTEDLVTLSRRGHGDGVGIVQAHLARGPRWEPLEPLETGLRPYAILAGDVGGDGVADVFVSAQNSHHVNRWIYTPLPSPRLARTPDLGAGTGCLDLALADVDGDGRLDLVVANAFSDDLAVLFGAP